MGSRTERDAESGGTTASGPRGVMMVGNAESGGCINDDGVVSSAKRTEEDEEQNGWMERNEAEDLEWKLTTTATTRNDIERRQRSATGSSITDLSPIRKLPQIVVNDKDRRRQFVAADCLRYGIYIFAFIAVVSGMELIDAEAWGWILIIASRIIAGFVGMFAAYNQSWLLAFGFAGLSAVAYSTDIIYYAIWWYQDPEGLAVHHCNGIQDFADCIHSRLDNGPRGLIFHVLLNCLFLIGSCYSGISFGLLVFRIERDFFAKWKQDDELRGLETCSSVGGDSPLANRFPPWRSKR